MSVRMALAKLCACACGGAIVGGGAVHVAEHRHVVRVHHVAHPTVAIRRAHRVVTRTTATCSPTVVTIANESSPISLPAAVPAFAPGGGEVVPAVIGGTGGFGGGFGGGFFGGSAGGSGGTVVSPALGSSGNVSIPSSTGGASAGVDVDDFSNNGSTGSSMNSATASNDKSNVASNASTASNTNNNANQNSGSQAQDQGGSQDQYGSSGKGWTANGGTPPRPPLPTPSGAPTDPATPVPAPPMVLLFGAAALALVVRRWMARRPAVA